MCHLCSYCGERSNDVEMRYALGSPLGEMCDVCWLSFGSSDFRRNPSDQRCSNCRSTESLASCGKCWFCCPHGHRSELRDSVCSRCNQQSEPFGTAHNVKMRYSLGLPAGRMCDACWLESGYRDEGPEGFDPSDAGESYEADFRRNPDEDIIRGIEQVHAGNIRPPLGNIRCIDCGCQFPPTKNGWAALYIHRETHSLKSDSRRNPKRFIKLTPLPPSKLLKSYPYLDVDFRLNPKTRSGHCVDCGRNFAFSQRPLKIIPHQCGSCSGKICTCLPTTPHGERHLTPEEKREIGYCYAHQAERCHQCGSMEEARRVGLSLALCEKCRRGWNQGKGYVHPLDTDDPFNRKLRGELFGIAGVPRQEPLDRSRRKRGKPSKLKRKSKKKRKK